MNLAPIKTLIRQRCGLLCEGNAERTLAASLARRQAACGLDGLDSYHRRLQADDHEFHALVELLTINETYFYREPEQLHFAVEQLVPRLFEQHAGATKLRILSAGCSSGEELVSIAIALEERYGAAILQRCHLAGGDIDHAALHRANAGRYAEFSFRTLPATLRERHFEAAAGQAWTVREELRRHCHFHYLNLLDNAEGEHPGPFDLIFFRNVSIYFDGPTRAQVMANLAARLAPHGALITGSAETLANDIGILRLVQQGTVFYFVAGTPGSAAPSAPAPAAALSAVGEWIAAAPASRNSAPAALTPVANGAPPQPPSDPIAHGLDLIHARQWEAARALLEAAHAQAPFEPRATLLCAYLALLRQDYALADTLAQQVLDGDAWSLDALMVKALSAKSQARTDEAIRWLKQAVYACHHCWPAQYYLAEQYRAGGRTDLARRAYRSALTLLAAGGADGMAVIPLALPASEVRYLCQHQLDQLGAARAKAGS